MKSIRHTLIASALLASLSGLVLAQAIPDAKTESPRAQRMAQMHTKMGERHAQHLSELKGKLNLEVGQENAWMAFSQSMQMSSQTRVHPDHASMQKLTTPERIDQMQAHKAARDAEMQKRAEAAKIFYASLNAGQKKVFDAETARLMQGMGHKMGRETSHHGHH